MGLENSRLLVLSVAGESRAEPSVPPEPVFSGGEPLEILEEVARYHQDGFPPLIALAQTGMEEKESQHEMHEEGGGKFDMSGKTFAGINVLPAHQVCRLQSGRVWSFFLP